MHCHWFISLIALLFFGRVSSNFPFSWFVSLLILMFFPLFKAEWSFTCNSGDVCFPMISDVSPCPSPGSFTVFRDRHSLALPNCVFERRTCFPLILSELKLKNGMKNGYLSCKIYSVLWKRYFSISSRLLVGSSWKISLEELGYSTLSRAGMGTKTTLDAGSPFHPGNTETKKTQNFTCLCLLSFSSWLL